jgi:hypothetical protein
MQKHKSQPNRPALFALPNQHIEVTIPQPIEQCIRHVQWLNRLPNSWLDGSKPDVNVVPMGDDLTKFHVMRRINLNVEVEVLGTLQRVTDKSTVVVGMARLPQSSVLTLVLYAALIIGGIFFVQVIIPNAIGIPYPFAAPVILIWIGIVVVTGVRAIYARNRLIHLLSDALEMDRY